MKILVVDDEKLLVKGIKFNLENEGYTVEACYDGETAVEMARAGDYDLIILDLMMPRKDGLEACQEIRGFSTVPIIMLTARSEDADMLMGFESGADDYVTKPFNILALKARVRALLRRASITAAPEQSGGGSLTAGHIRLDEQRRSAMKNGVEVELTMKEFDLMLFLMKNPGKVFSRESLLNLVWGYDYQGDTRTVDVHIRRLREKLELTPAQPQYIITKWGVGYYFAGCEPEKFTLPGVLFPGGGDGAAVAAAESVPHCVLPGRGVPGKGALHIGEGLRPFHLPGKAGQTGP